MNDRPTPYEVTQLATQLCDSRRVRGKDTPEAFLQDAVTLLSKAAIALDHFDYEQRQRFLTKHRSSNAEHRTP